MSQNYVKYNKLQKISETNREIECLKVTWNIIHQKQIKINKKKGFQSHHILSRNEYLAVKRFIEKREERKRYKHKQKQ